MNEAYWVSRCEKYEVLEQRKHGRPLKTPRRNSEKMSLSQGKTASPGSEKIISGDLSVMDNKC